MLHLNETPTSFPGAVRVPRDVRCLLLDDSSFDRARIRRLARQTHLSIQMDEVDSIQQLSAAVMQTNYDIILIDYRLPVGDGMLALDHVMKSAQNRNAGKIMITGDGARQTAVKAMRAGCHDFIMKDEMSADALREAMVNALVTSQCRQNLRRQIAEQDEASRGSLITEIQDDEAQENVVSLLRARALSRPAELFDPNDVEGLLAALDNGDDIVFH